MVVFMSANVTRGSGKELADSRFIRDLFAVVGSSQAVQDRLLPLEQSGL